MLAAALKAEARRLGFELVGVAPAVTPAGIGDFLEWIAAGYAGEMQYLPRRADAYRHPDSVLEGVRSVVMLGLNYRSADPPELGPLDGRVARYAWGSADYHDLIRSKLDQLIAFTNQQAPGCRTRGVVDTAPLLERDFARLAGLGWFGKNTLLINRPVGSWFFLAALLTDLELDYDLAQSTAHCGTCTRCLEACPTDAFVGPYTLDARKCISYLTIEHRGPIPVELRAPMGNWLFGCDICQDVCPWNRKAPVTDEPAFQPQPDLTPADCLDLLALDDAAFRKKFRHTPLARPKRAGMLRNAAIVLGNSRGGDPRDGRAVLALAQALEDHEPVIRGAAAWALGRLGGDVATTALSTRLPCEEDPTVSEEIKLALKELKRVELSRGSATTHRNVHP